MTVDNGRVVTALVFAVFFIPVDLAVDASILILRGYLQVEYSHGRDHPSSLVITSFTFTACSSHGWVLQSHGLSLVTFLIRMHAVTALLLFIYFIIFSL